MAQVPAWETGMMPALHQTESDGSQPLYSDSTLKTRSVTLHEKEDKKKTFILISLEYVIVKTRMHFFSTPVNANNSPAINVFD